MKQSQITVAVALSGGVDSAVALFLLKQQGYDVFALFMKNWDEKNGEGECSSAQDAEDAKAVCLHLNVPFFVVNFCEEYWQDVFTSFLKDLENGGTPNPDVLCNREIKFKHLFKKAKQLGADLLATGHYCQTINGSLLKGKDPNKDQSYFLSMVSGDVFKEVLFPIGHLDKQTVRRIAKENGLPVCNKKESMGICFIGKKHFPRFIKNYLEDDPGVIETVDGKVIGHHRGVHYFTIGQRRGLGIGGEGDPWFVVRKDKKSKKVFVAQGENHPALFTNELFGRNPFWIQKAPHFPYQCMAKIRYRQSDQKCTVYQMGQRLHVLFERPQRGVTPEQLVVFYRGEHCIGSSIITQGSTS